MSPQVQVIVTVTIVNYFTLGYVWGRDTVANLFSKYVFYMMGFAWTIVLLKSLGYLGGK